MLSLLEHVCDSIITGETGVRVGSGRSGIIIHQVEEKYAEGTLWHDGQWQKTAAE